MSRFVPFIVAVFVGVFSPENPALAQSSRDKLVTVHGDFFRLLWHDRSDLFIGGMIQPFNSEKDGPGDFDLMEIRVRSELPVALDQDRFFRIGFDYEPSFYDFDDVRGARTRLESEVLHKIQLKFGYGTFLNEDLLFTGVFRPGIYSDIDESISEEDLRYHGDGLLAYRFIPGAQLVGGARYDETFDDTPLLPFGGVRWQSESGELLLSLTIPLEARIGYNFDPSVQLYGGYWISGDAYHVHLGRDDQSFNIQREDRRLGMGVNYWLATTVSLNAEAGASIGSRLEFKAEDAGQFADEEGDLDPAGYLIVGVGFAL